MKRNDDAFPSHPGRPYNARPRPQQPLVDLNSGGHELIAGASVPQGIKGLKTQPGLVLHSDDNNVTIVPRLTAGPGINIQPKGWDLEISAPSTEPEDTGWIPVGLYGPYPYESRFRFRAGATWGNWTAWTVAGSKNHAWVQRSPGPPEVRKIGDMFFLRGFIQRNTDTALPANVYLPDSETEYRWVTTPEPERYICYRPAAITSWTSQQETPGFRPSSQNDAASTGIAIYYNPIAFTSGAGPNQHGHGTWVRLSHAWAR